METNCQKVLDKLVQNRNAGVTFSDFATGFRLAARIHDLREMGVQIQKIDEPIGDTRRARYVLQSQAALQKPLPLPVPKSPKPKRTKPMSRFNLTPDPELLKSFGILAHLPEKERQQCLALPSGRFKPALKELTKEVRAAQKQEAQRRKEEARRLRQAAGV